MAIQLLQEERITTSPIQGLASLVGNTPLLPLRRLGKSLPEGVKLYGKAEWFNPSGSVKDRPAVNILRTALDDGRLDGQKRLLDSTSGNMGIAYATFGASLGVPVTLALPANASPERIKILRALGAELVLTDAAEGSDGALRAAMQLAETHPETYYYANQYANPANWQAHYLTTGPEIVQQTGGEVTHFIAGMGTTGTLMGTGKYLRAYNPEIKLVGVQPDSPFHGLEGLKHLPSAIRPPIFDPDLPDEIIEVSTESAYTMVMRAARAEGLFVGISAGAALAAALRLAQEIKQGNIVIIFADAGYKYLSESFWEGTKT